MSLPAPPMEFRKIPTILTAQELIDRAFRRASRAPPSGGGTDSFARLRTLTVSRIREAENVIAGTLTKYVQAFPSFERLHPFHRELADLVTDEDAVRKNLGAIDWAAHQVRRITEETAAAAKRARTRDVCHAARRAAYGRVSSVVEQVAPALAALGKARDRLRKLPAIDPAARTIVVAGYPNVGKSSFLAAVSRAAPEVAPYPFTTKGLLVGHVERDGDVWQVIDTPGLLDRPMEERNPAERHAVLALRHLGHAVIFLVDATGHCGYPLDAQERLLAEVRRLFPGRGLVEVETKGDLAEGPPARGRLRMSTSTGAGVAEVLEAALDLARKAEVGDGSEAQGGRRRRG